MQDSVNLISRLSSAAYCFQKVLQNQILLGGWRLMCFLSRAIFFSEKKKSNVLLVVEFQTEVKGVSWVKWAVASTPSSIFKAGRVDQMPSDISLVVFLARHSLCFAHCYLKIKPITPPSLGPSDSPMPILVTCLIPCSILNGCGLQKLTPLAILSYLMCASILSTG